MAKLTRYRTSESRLMAPSAVNLDRPFGGLNVLFVGDFFQLDPPTGTPINTLPIEWIKKRANMPQDLQEIMDNIYFGANKKAV